MTPPSVSAEALCAGFGRLFRPLRRPAVWVPVAILSALVVLLEYYGLDLRLEDLFWVDDASPHWLVDRDDYWNRLLFYRLPRWLETGIAIATLAAWLASFFLSRLRPWRRQFLFVTLSIVLVTALVGEIKAVTNVHCPSQLVRYNGDQPDDALALRLFEHVETTTRGRCFPAGHASGGFSLLALGWLSHNRWRRIGGWAVGIAAGSVTGGYQMLNGLHFLSHTLATLLIALAVTAWLAGVILPGNRHRKAL
jgi:membrane-associated PAP2 superfamily phosphatase